MRATRAATVDQLAASADLRLNLMRANGTTTAEIKTGYGLSLEAELNALKAIDAMYKPGGVEIVPTFLGAHAVPPEFADTPRLPRHVTGHAARRRRVYNYSPFAHSMPFIVMCSRRNAFASDHSRALLPPPTLASHAPRDEFTDLGGGRLPSDLRAVGRPAD